MRPHENVLKRDPRECRGTFKPGLVLATAVVGSVGKLFAARNFAGGHLPPRGQVVNRAVRKKPRQQPRNLCAESGLAEISIAGGWRVSTQEDVRVSVFGSGASIQVSRPKPGTRTPRLLYHRLGSSPTLRRFRVRPTASFAAPLLLVALCAIAAGCGSIGGGEAACAAMGPRVEAEPARAAPAETFVLLGEGFADYSGRGGRLRDECPRLLPERGIPVELVQGDRTWALARVDGGEDLAFEAEIEVPADAAPGEAVVRATSRGRGLAEAHPPAEAPLLVFGGKAGP